MENNINITPPEGEVCFGNTITSCLTLCIIFDNNFKISLHINPVTTLFAKKFGDENILKNETINQFTIIEKITEKITENKSLFRRILDYINVFSRLFRNNFYIKKIILLGSLSYNIYETNSGEKFISDEFAEYPEIAEILEIKKTDIKIEDFLQEKLAKYINRKYKFVLMQGKEIKKKSVYIVKHDGTGIIYNEINEIIDEF